MSYLINVVATCEFCSAVKPVIAWNIKAMAPTPDIPAHPEGWHLVDGKLACEKHNVLVDNTESKE
jgi:hypothetical protein